MWHIVYLHGLEENLKNFREHLSHPCAALLNDLCEDRGGTSVLLVLHLP